MSHLGTVSKASQEYRQLGGRVGTRVIGVNSGFGGSRVLRVLLTIHHDAQTVNRASQTVVRQFGIRSEL